MLSFHVLSKHSCYANFVFIILDFVLFFLKKPAKIKWASGFTKPVPVGWVALTVLICPLVGWVGRVASRPAWFGACRWAQSRCQGPFLSPPSDSLPKSELHEGRDLFLPLSRPAPLTIAPGTWQDYGPKEVNERTRDRRMKGAATWLLGGADPGPRPLGLIQRDEGMRQLWPWPWLTRRKSSTPITKPQKRLSKKSHYPPDHMPLGPEQELLCPLTLGWTSDSEQVTLWFSGHRVGGEQIAREVMRELT